MSTPFGLVPHPNSGLKSPRHHVSKQGVEVLDVAASKRRDRHRAVGGELDRIHRRVGVNVEAAHEVRSLRQRIGLPRHPVLGGQQQRRFAPVAVVVGVGRHEVSGGGGIDAVDPGLLGERHDKFFPREAIVAEQRDRLPGAGPALAECHEAGRCR